MSLTEMSATMRFYVLAVAVVGPAFALAIAIAGIAAPGSLSTIDIVRAVVLTIIIAAAYGRPLRITHSFTYDLSEVVIVAALLLFPPWLPGLIVLVGAAVHYLWQTRWTIPDLFNLGQSTLTVTLAAITLGLPGWHTEAHLASLGSIGALVVAGVVMLTLNTGLIAGAIALDAGGDFWRLWRAQVINVGPTFAALVALGVVVALVIRDYPLALIPLVVPALLVQLSLRREVQLRADERAAVAALADMIELRDPYTAGHSRRVATLARELAVRLGRTGEEADLIETAGRVHDIAKVAIREAVLLKFGPLTDDEWREMKRHPVLGAEVVHRFAGYQECELLVRHHHERWDGKGYPDGLAGDAIPFGARILAVADSFDALSSSRPYRSALGLESVLRILEEGAGTQWDPAVVGALVAYQRELAAPARLAGRPVVSVAQ